MKVKMSFPYDLYRTIVKIHSISSHQMIRLYYNIALCFFMFRDGESSSPN